MDRPATEIPTPTTEEGKWLVDAGNSLLTDDVLARLDDDTRPHRLAWNTLRTLALWNSDIWVPAMLELACGTDNRLSPLEWGGTAVLPWPAPLDAPDVSDFVLDGPEAYVLVACTMVSDPSELQLRAAAIAALDGSLHPAREAGLVVVAPPGSDDMPARLQAACNVELHDGRLISDLLEGAMGWVSWPELGRLALDLAEENDAGPEEQVHQLVSELQACFPDAEI